MVRDGHRDRDTNIKRLINDLIETKLQRNREIGATQASRVDALSSPERRRRLAQPEDHVSPGEQKGFNSLAYLHGTRPDRAEVDRLVQRVLLPLLFN